MATKIPRKTQKIFAGSAANNGQFGSAQLGTKVTTTDIATIQALSAWDTGWNSATISSLQLPPLEEMQGVQYVETTQIAYLLQEGIAEYDAGTHYFQNSIVKQVGTTKLYKSKTDDNVGNALTDTVNWQFLLDLANPESNIIWGGTAGGTANAITITSTLSALPTPAIILFLASANNTAATTLVVGTAPSINITKGGNGVVGLAPNDITTGKLIAVVYDGTQGQLLNPPAFAHGADVVAAGTTVLDNTSGDILNITGNTGITAITLKEGRLKICKFSGTPILTYGASLLLNTGGANYTCAANDVVMFYGLASGVVVGTIYPASGSSPVPPAQTFTASGGDVTGTGALTSNINLVIGANKVLTTMINNNAVTLAKIANASANSVLLGAGSSGSGSAYTQITLGGNLSMTGTVLSGNQKLKYATVEATGNFTTSANITTTTPFTFIVVGGGGGGAGNSTALGGACGGAGATEIWKGVTGLSPSSNYSCTIGGGGAGGASGTNAGTNGGNTSITIGSDTVTAPGGVAGSAAYVGGRGGLGSSAPGVGTITHVGGGDGSGGIASNYSLATANGGASSQGGGAGGNYQGAGLNAQAFGAGGSGGNGLSGTGNFAGGNGKGGIIIAIWAE